MKRVLFVLMLALFAAVQAFAQMSDEEVIAFVQAEHEAGKSQQAIMIDLQKKGVKKEQLLRLKEQYESGQLSNIPSASASSSVDSRTRKANGNIPERTGEIVGNVAVATKEIFGHDIFQNEKLTFEPNMNIATPSSYILGPGDEVLIDVYGTSQSSKKYAVSPEGTIIVEKIGPVEVAGLTVEQAQAKVSAKMGQHYQGSSIKLTIGQTRTVVVNVLGEVVYPGTYTLSAFATVFNALYLAGGITELGTLRNILVSRNGKIVSKIDVYDYILNGKLTGNILLQDNDAIIVGTRWGGMQPTMELLKSMVENGEKDFSPTLFMQSTHNTAATTLARLLGSHGYNITLSIHNLSFDFARAFAFVQLNASDLRNVLVCGYDEEVPEWQQLLEKVEDSSPAMAKAFVIKKE